MSLNSVHIQNKVNKSGFLILDQYQQYKLFYYPILILVVVRKIPAVLDNTTEWKGI